LFLTFLFSPCRHFSNVGHLCDLHGESERDRLSARGADKDRYISTLFQPDLVPAAAFLTEQYHFSVCSDGLDLHTDAGGRREIDDQLLPRPSSQHIGRSVTSSRALDHSGAFPLGKLDPFRRLSICLRRENERNKHQN